jgi:hypothetical protein
MGFGDFEWDDAANVENDIFEQQEIFEGVEKKA